MKRVRFTEKQIIGVLREQEAGASVSQARRFEMINGVRHDPTSARYELSVGTSKAIVTYSREGDIVTFKHTSVPKELEGQGVASRLIAGALDDVRDHSLKVWFSQIFP